MGFQNNIPIHKKSITELYYSSNSITWKTQGDVCSGLQQLNGIQGHPMFTFIKGVPIRNTINKEVNVARPVLTVKYLKTLRNMQYHNQFNSTDNSGLTDLGGLGGGTWGAPYVKFVLTFS